MDINQYVDVSTRVLHSHQRQSVTIEPKYSFFSFKDGAEYNVFVRPRHEYTSQVLTKNRGLYTCFLQII